MEQTPVDPAQALPIDIAYNKLADWLVDRRKVPKDFRKRLAVVRARVSVALSQLQRNIDPGFLDLTPDCTGFFEAKYIRDVLAALPESRNLFGRLAGAAGEWVAIVSAYEKDSIFLGEAAQVMVQSSNYDIPFHKKQIAKLQQQLVDLERKESELKRSAVQSATKYREACMELGIPGINIRAELVGLGATLPKIFAEIINELCSNTVGSALDYYQAFSAYAHGIREDDHVLPTLTELRAHPPDTHAVLNPPTSNAGAQPNHQDDMSKTSQTDVETTEIDWGVETGEVDPSLPIDIDWDIGGALEELEIQDNNVPGNLLQDPEEKASSHGNQSEELVNNGEVTSKPDISWDVEIPTEIDWDIGVEENGAASVTLETWDLRTESEPGFDGKVAEGEFAPPSWFAKADNRNSLLDDLFELMIFLKQRLLEIDNDETSGILNLVRVVAPSSIPQHEYESLEAMKSNIAKVIDLISKRRTRDLILIATSPGYLNRLERSLTQKKQSELKLQNSIVDLDKKRQEYRTSQGLLWPKQEALIARTLTIKQHVEEILSAQYNGRRVNIVGEINTLLGRV